MAIRYAYLLMNSKSQIACMLVALCFLLGCKNQNSSTKSLDSVPPTQSAWDHESGAIKIRYLNDTAKTLKEWWLDGSVVTIEMEAPPLEFFLETDAENPLKQTKVDLEADKINYKITIVHGRSGQRLEVQVRIFATRISPEFTDGITYSRRTNMSGELVFESDSYGSSPGFPAANMMNDENLYLWGASPVGDDKYIRLMIRPAD